MFADRDQYEPDVFEIEDMLNEEYELWAEERKMDGLPYSYEAWLELNNYFADLAL